LFFHKYFSKKLARDEQIKAAAAKRKKKSTGEDDDEEDVTMDDVEEEEEEEAEEVVAASAKVAKEPAAAEDDDEDDPEEDEIWKVSLTSGDLGSLLYVKLILFVRLRQCKLPCLRQAMTMMICWKTAKRMRSWNTVKMKMKTRLKLMTVIRMNSTKTRMMAGLTMLVSCTDCHNLCWIY
jgi:archaellum component FlaD/FlaE